MRLDTIIRILDNKEYDEILWFHKNGAEYLQWYDMLLGNEDIIRLEHFDLYEEDKYRVMYFTSESDRALEVWESDYRESSYYIFKNLFNDAKRYYNSINGVE